MTDWTVDPKPVPPELEPEYRAEPYRDPFMVPVLEKLDAATRDDLLRLLGGYPVAPE